jgi:predicted DNA-binding transcriptional regulator AlpA
MRLRDYLAQRQGSRYAVYGQFADEIGVQRSTIYRLCDGLYFPKLSTLTRIVERTDGAVTANDFLGLERAPPSGRGRPREPVKSAAE